MNEVNKFKTEIDDIIDELSTLCFVLRSDNEVLAEETVSNHLEVYEDTVDRLKLAFDTLRAEAGSKLVKDL